MSGTVSFFLLTALLAFAPASAAVHKHAHRDHKVPAAQGAGASFQKALARTLRKEGGYVNRTGDRGGETYRGIARAFHPDWEGWAAVDSVKHALDLDSTLDRYTETHVTLDRALLADKALNRSITAFYKREFWDPLRLSREANQARANAIFDYAVRHGLKAARSRPKTSKPPKKPA